MKKTDCIFFNINLNICNLHDLFNCDICDDYEEVIKLG
jgi:hypothetical protein